MANKFGAQLRGGLSESEKKVEQALINQKPEQMTARDTAPSAVTPQPSTQEPTPVQDGSAVATEPPIPNTPLSPKGCLPEQEPPTPTNSPVPYGSAAGLISSLPQLWDNFLLAHQGQPTNGANVQMPVDLDNRVNTIKNHLRTLRMPRTLNKKELLLLMIAWGCERLESEINGLR